MHFPTENVLQILFFLSGDLSDGESVVNWLQEFVSTPDPSLQEGSAQYDEDHHV